MMPQEQGGVVNNRLQVHGVHGLRIVDASIFPLIVDGHPQASRSASETRFVRRLLTCPALSQGAVYMVAEKAADMIKDDRNLT